MKYELFVRLSDGDEYMAFSRDTEAEILRAALAIEQRQFLVAEVMAAVPVSVRATALEVVPAASPTHVPAPQSTSVAKPAVPATSGTRASVWSAESLERLRVAYATGGIRACVAAFPERNRKSVENALTHYNLRRHANRAVMQPAVQEIAERVEEPPPVDLVAIEAKLRLEAPALIAKRDGVAVALPKPAVRPPLDEDIRRMISAARAPEREEETPKAPCRLCGAKMFTLPISADRNAPRECRDRRECDRRVIRGGARVAASYGSQLST